MISLTTEVAYTKQLFRCYVATLLSLSTKTLLLFLLRETASVADVQSLE